MNAFPRCFLLISLLAPTWAARAITFEPEDAAPAPTPPPPPTWSTPQVSFDLSERLAVDTAFDLPGENVASLLQRARLSLATEKGPVRLHLEARLRWNTTMEALDGTRRRSAFEPGVGETYVEATTGKVRWDAGFLDFVWGSNAAFAPADVLVPMDFRDGPLAGPMSRLPVPAVRARGELGPLSFDAVYLPVFVPSRLPLFGNDWGPFLPGRQMAIPDLSRQIDPTLLPTLETAPAATRLPQLDLTAPQGGMRLSAHPGSWDVALTWAEFFDRQPRYSLSPGFEKFSEAFQENDRGGALTALVQMQEERDAGVQPITAEYVRTRVFAFDAAVSAGPVRWTIDAGYSPKRVLPTIDLHTAIHPMATGVIGLEYEGPPVLAAGVATFAVFDVPAGETLLYLDAPNAPAVHRNVVLPLGYLTAAHRLLDDRLRLAATALASSRGDWMAVPSVGWSLGDAQAVSLGALLLGGPSGGMGWAYHHNEEAFLQYDLQL